MHATRDIAIFLGLVTLLSVTAAPSTAAAASGGDEYQITWVATARETRLDGHLEEGARDEVPIDVACCNVARVELYLSWIETDDALGVSRADTFRVALRDPSGTEAAPSVASSRGILSLDPGPVQEAPPARTVRAADADGARATAADVAVDSGVGRWVAVVALEDAGNPSGLDADTGNAYVLAVIVQRYEPVVQRIVALEGDGSGPAGLATDRPFWQYSALALAGAATGLAAFIVRHRLRTDAGRGPS